MRGRLFIYWAILLLLPFSCSKEMEQEQEPLQQAMSASSVEGRPVTIEFDVPGFGPATKALGEGGELHSLHLAVFGGSGYLKEYVEATPVRIDDYTYEMADKDGNLVPRTVPCYRFSVKLITLCRRKPHSSSLILFEEFFEAFMHLERNVWPVVEAGTPQALLVKAEAERLHQMKNAVGSGRRSGDIARIGRYFRFYQYYV